MGRTWARPAEPPASAIPVARGSRWSFRAWSWAPWAGPRPAPSPSAIPVALGRAGSRPCLLYTSDAADDM
eukprot:7502343-Alexandrium_andersonii.AAC.1